LILKMAVLMFINTDCVIFFSEQGNAIALKSSLKI
jgi:hypothetical protein